jgi:aldehyde:ferredoxin oxidoreductase
MNSQKIGYIDISTGECQEEDITDELRSQFLGGRGINIYLLYTHTTAHTKALEPDNPLIVGAGLLSGTPAPCAARCSIAGKSPETGLLGDSNLGGFFASQLRKTGYDHLVVRGRSPEPVYLYLERGKIQIRDASHLWGKDTLETTALLKEAHGPSSQSLMIGPAGENLVRFATVRHGRKNTAGRTGLGCLMGAKKVKAIVAKGGRPPALKDPAEMGRYCRELVRLIKGTRSTEVLHRYGTPVLFDLHNLRGILRTLNGQLNQFKDGRGLRSSHLKGYYTESKGCFGCPIRCQHGYKVGAADGKELIGDGLEYGVLGALGPICGINNLESLFRINDLLNRAGLDASSTGNIIAWVMELFQRGLISEAETGGLTLSWGDEAVITELIKQIVERRGFGSLLADGAKEASEKLGEQSQKYLIWSKYLPQSDSVDVRAYKGFALGVATSTRGADHLRSRPTLEALNLSSEELREVYGQSVPNDPTAYQGKAHMVWWSEINFVLGDALGICRFAQKFNNINQLGLEEFSRLIYYATGRSLSYEELIRIGERIITLERMFLKREGIDRKSDSLPDRYFDEPLPLGPYKGEKLDRAAFNRMLDDYYQIHHWDVITGQPKGDVVKDLGLGAVVTEEDML